MQQLYFVAVLAAEPAQSEVRRFMHDLHERFGTKAALKSPAHITLVPPFDFLPANENLLSEGLKMVAENLSSLHIQLNGFDSFPKQTIFVRVEEETQLQDLQKKAKSVFQKMPGNKSRPDTRPFHPHMTIGNRDWQEDDFDTAWNEYRDKLYKADFIAEKIHLLRLESGKWEIADTAFFSYTI